MDNAEFDSIVQARDGESFPERIERIAGEFKRRRVGQPRRVLYVDLTMKTEHGYRPVVVVEGESGYYHQGNPDKLQQPWYFGHDFDEAHRRCVEFNAALGVSEKDARDIGFQSMFPGARKLGS